MRILTLTLLLLVSLSAPGMAAGTIDIVTYYDVPDGDFLNLTVTGAVTLADDAGASVLIAPPPNAGGPTSFGTVVGVRPLTVTANNANFPAVFMRADGNGLFIGSRGGLIYGEISGRNTLGGDAPLYLNAAGGNVGVGATAAAAYQLEITGANNNLGITNGLGQTAEVKFAWATDGYYATYSP